MYLLCKTLHICAEWLICCNSPVKNRPSTQIRHRTGTELISFYEVSWPDLTNMISVHILFLAFDCTGSFSNSQDEKTSFASYCFIIYILKNCAILHEFFLSEKKIAFSLSVLYNNLYDLAAMRAVRLQRSSTIRRLV